MKHALLILCIAVLCVILTLGLWPFHAPGNDVAWLKNRDGIRFGYPGTAIGTGSIHASGSADPQSCSVEIWLLAARADQEGTALTLYLPNVPARFALHQSLSDLELQSGKSRRHHFYVNDVFRRDQPVFITITSGVSGTAVYGNGKLLRMVRGFHLTPCAGKLIVGDSPRQQDPWSGQVRGLAIYANELAPPAVLRHYDSWTKTGRPEVAKPDQAVALYLFDERAGDIVHNRAQAGVDLVMPATYRVQDKLFLEPFWEEFELSWSFVKGVLKNVVGFVPLGFCFYAYFTAVCKIRRAALASILVGFAVSLTIEVLQGYLPTRDSGTTDLITNTLGTWIGVALYQAGTARFQGHSRLAAAAIKWRGDIRTRSVFPR